MKTLFLALTLGLTGLTVNVAAQAQTSDPATDTSIAAKHAIGEVKSIDAAAKLITIKTDAGTMVGFLVPTRRFTNVWLLANRV